MLVGLHGESRSGKDTVALILNEEAKFHWLSFATPLRNIILKMNLKVGGIDLFDAVNTHSWDWVKSEFPEVVDWMIGLGQAARDELGQDVWLDAALRRIGDHENVVISDVRQPNEYRAIKDLGGEVWLVKRPGTVARGMDHLLDGAHFDVTIHNNSTLAELEIKVLAALELYGWSG